MKKILIPFFAFIALIMISSCEKDEGKLPNINLKLTVGYIYGDTTMPAGTIFKIGINASKAEDKDVLKQFNVSESINGGALTSIFDKTLSGSEGDNYSYDLQDTLGSVSGQINKYTFTVTNRDGITNQVIVNVTIQ